MVPIVDINHIDSRLGLTSLHSREQTKFHLRLLEYCLLHLHCEFIDNAARED